MALTVTAVSLSFQHATRMALTSEADYPQRIIGFSKFENNSNSIGCMVCQHHVLCILNQGLRYH